MTKTYKAHLKNNRLEWSEPVPAALTEDREVEVWVTVIHPARVERSERGQRAAALLEALARRATADESRSGLTEIADPVAWQREQRADRSLPGREK